MADLFIPAALRIWLFSLLTFVLLDYSVPFSILFGAIAGVAGGLVSAWWQIKGGSPSSGFIKGLEPTDKLKQPDPNGSDEGPAFELPFLKTNKAKKRYMERRKRARDRRLTKR
ncbi:MAG: hypothetical protein AAFY72_00990 [Cyanobacteria bacterium J06649_4]